MAEESANGSTSAASKVAMQLTKLRDANVKYKNLLKLAKERIQQQEDELTRLRGKYTCMDDPFIS